MEPNPDAFRDLSNHANEQNLDLGVMDQLLNLDDGESGLLKEMFGLFQDDLPDKIQAIEVTLAAGELADMADLAHSIKGAAGTMGVPRLRDIAAELEGAGRKGAFSTDSGLLLGQLKSAYADGKAALEAFIAKRDNLFGAS